jgi:hypothetical protein
MTVNRVVACPECHQLCAWCSWYEGLTEELLRQWESNHSEHCGSIYPHEGECHWPKPAVLSRRSPKPDWNAHMDDVKPAIDALQSKRIAGRSLPPEQEQE